MTQRITLALAWRPEWPYAILVVLSWIGVFAWHGGSHTVQHGVAMAASHGSELIGWTLMIAAMMLPLTLPALGHVAVNSIRTRRQRAMAIYAVFFGATWVAFGAAVIGARDAVVALGVWNDRLCIVATLIIAAAWQISPFKRRALYGCQKTIPLPPQGLAADRACARFGVLQGLRCIRSCWALMLVTLVPAQGILVTMAALSGLLLLEQYTVVGRRLVRLSAGTLFVLASLPAYGVSSA
ncbi:MAG: DUF2182 domain-containing protein [Chloroflexota bacterium]